MGNLNASLSKENFGNSSSFGCESGNRLALGVKPSANSQPLPKQYMSVDFHLELELAVFVFCCCCCFGCFGGFGGFGFFFFGQQAVVETARSRPVH